MSDDLLGGRYRLDAVLGRGGMAAVWRGSDTRLGRPVAVKVLDGAGLTDPSAVQRFRREAQTVARLTDPHVVAVYDVGSDGDRHYLVMELVEGASLAALLRSGPLDAARAVDIAAQVCAALGAAHAAGVVHRDVKPGNILVDDNGTVKVCDFGVARLLNAAQPTLTAVGAAVGTSRYMAPEQVNGEPVDGRTDLYALGCVLYAMLTGAPPFEGDAAVSIALQHLHSDPEPIARRRPDLPGALAALVDRLLAKNPDDRPQTAAEVRAALAGVGTASLAGGTHTGPAGLPRATPIPPERATSIPPQRATSIPSERATPPAPVRAMAAVTSPTRTMPVFEDRVPAPSQERLRSPWAVLAAVVVAGIVIAGLALLLPSENPRRSADDPAPGAAPAATTPAATTAAPAPTTRPATPRPGGRLVEWIGALRTALAAETAAGRLDPKGAREIGKKLDDLEKELAEGDGEKAVEKTRDVARKLQELRRKGKISDAGWDSLGSAMGELSDRLPSTREDLD